jgi:ABC-type branched-subunit amino acid transport system substrate-binding protein
VTDSRPTLRIGIVFSTSGPYAALGREGLDGALMALAELNEDPASPVRLEARIGDPAGQTDQYPAIAERLLKLEGCRHIVGGITSWSRKEMIPVIERHDGLLWYPCPYEGYECNDRVVYLGACPNQHIVPLFAHVLPRFGANGYLVGSNYIWGWETNRIARELIAQNGGEVVGERYLPLGATDIGRIIGEIVEKRPDFVLNTLIGPSSYAFFEAYAAVGRDDPDFGPDRRPVVSCNLTEVELGILGDAAVGHLATAVYFDSLPGTANAAFRARVAARFGADRRPSAFMVGAYDAVKVLAASAVEAGRDDPEMVRAIATGRSFDSPAGPLSIDPNTQHATLRPLLGRASADGSFEIIGAAPAAVRADPYLIALDGAPAANDGGPDPAGTATPILRVIR